MAADAPEEVHAIVNAISYSGHRPGHRQTENDGVIVEEGDGLLRVGEVVRLVYLEVVNDQEEGCGGETVPQQPEKASFLHSEPTGAWRTIQNVCLFYMVPGR